MSSTIISKQKLFEKLIYGIKINLPKKKIPRKSHSTRHYKTPKQKKLDYASANALRICDKNITLFNTHTETHPLQIKPFPTKLWDTSIDYWYTKHSSTGPLIMNLAIWTSSSIKMKKHTDVLQETKFWSGKNILLNCFREIKNKKNLGPI